ncbi:hypothetical protein Q9L42_018130 [Methylomarinum sp. Ch1-1]|uniref:Dynamin family protein n=1 Tax=Methylomarinum roseum TaxID=3067653 RepID=A0AAU7NUC7_9GAMM|nr:hypothetical protein [Methylomarinum sp. Ch1-1]MDP4519720.1 hypothetical protein [Methylomarinum sp. Ch1-1]
MAEKTVSKHLINLEKQFAPSNPVLQKAAKVFHELDQLEYDMGLIEQEETTARKSSWWPIISTLGGHSSAKNDFINRYLGTQLHSTSHKFTVHQYTHQSTSATLPGTALDADHRLPFYQISRSIEQIAKGEGDKINAYLELLTVNSEKLRGKLLIDTPVLSGSSANKVNALLNRHVIDMSDLVLVFCDLFDAESELIDDTIKTIIEYQDSNKFLFIIDHSEISLEPRKINEIIISWQRRLTELGINTGQFVVLTDSGDTSMIDLRIENLDNDRSYRVLSTLEKSIRHIDDVIIPEVENALTLWKDRANTSILIVLGFLVSLVLFAEISIGVLDLFFDPIIGPIILLILIAILTPLHLIISRIHAKLIVNKLHERQKRLNLTENLAGLFEKSLTFWRILLPIKDPVGKNKKTRNHLTQLIEQSKDLVQTLNDQFSHYQTDDLSSYTSPANSNDSIQ